jgi:hypothetical protein
LCVGSGGHSQETEDLKLHDRFERIFCKTKPPRGLKSRGKKENLQKLGEQMWEENRLRPPLIYTAAITLRFSRSTSWRLGSAAENKAIRHEFV